MSAAAGLPPRPRRSRPAHAQLVVMARWPAPGRCKRRLAAGIGPRRAAAIQRRLTAHTLTTAGRARERSRRAGGGAVPSLVLAVEGLGPRAARRWGRRLGADRVRLQGPGSLGLRLRRQLHQAQRQGAGAVVLIGSDLPSLDAADLREAFARLESDPLVLGPAHDGGYWLIGLAGAALASAAGGTGAMGRLFAGHDGAIGWGGAQVLQQTLAAAQAAGLAWTLLRECGDLDRPADLEAWR